MKSYLFTLRHLFYILILALGPSCSGGGGGSNPAPTDLSVSGPTTSGDPAAFRGAGIIQDPKYLIGGPLAQGRVGDILLQNDHIRLVIQKPKRNAGVALYGGNIIDADLTRGVGQAGQDNFGTTFPMINISWTPFYQKLEIINGDFTQGPVIVRATGVLDVYDYIQTSIIVPFAKIAKNGISLFFPDQYNDVLDPFENVASLKNVSTTIVTDYVLRSDKTYVIIQTHLMNSGKDPVPMPIGDWVNGSGTLETFFPKTGFSGQGLYYDVPAIVYTGLETNTGVSYGFFHDPTLFKNADETLRSTDVLTVSGVSIMGYGEKIAPGLIPFSSSPTPKINFSLPAGETIYTRYFAVGNGDASSVLQGGVQALGVPTYPLAGKVVDAQNQPVTQARVLLIDKGSKKPVTMLYSDPNGNFTGNVSSGSDEKAKLFGSGQYTVEVYKEGYLSSYAWADGTLEAKNKAGTCDTSGGLDKIQCTLGSSGLVQISAKDENGNPVPARIAIAGFDPSPYHKLPVNDVPADDSPIADLNFQGNLYGYIDTLFLDPAGKLSNSGNPRYVSPNIFRLEPGNYEIFVMRGPEYNLHAQRITVAPGGTNTVQATLKKVVQTPGYVSADFHVHGIRSPDSPYGLEARVHFALAEGLDIISSSDHDAVTDYSDTIKTLGATQLIANITGDEITPMAIGHLIAFPLAYDPNDPTGGAFDYTNKAGFSPGPNHHEMLSPDEVFTHLEEKNPGEQVLQVAHIMDNLLGNFSLSRLVTTTKFDGVPALASYADPVDFRLPPNTNSSGGFKPPFPLGTSALVSEKFTAMELSIGDTPLSVLFDTAIPTWFNFLNLGKSVAATANSDSHRQIISPIGGFRNYVLSKADPRDGTGSFAGIDPQEIAHNVNRQHVVVSSGPFLSVQAISAGVSQIAQVGDTLALSGGGAKDVTLSIHVESPDWVDWDTVEIYANSDPTPAKDDLSGPWDKSADEFVTVTVDSSKNINHLYPKYLYSPVSSFKRGGGGSSQTLTQSVSPNGLRATDIQTTLNLSEDTWLVVIVKGSSTTHTLFPYIPSFVNTTDAAVQPDKFLDTLDTERTTEGITSKIGGNRAFALTNPIYIDIDGNGYQAKYVREGKSPF